MRRDPVVAGLGVSCEAARSIAQLRELLQGAAGAVQPLGLAQAGGDDAASSFSEPMDLPAIAARQSPLARAIAERFERAWQRAGVAQKSVLSAAAQAWVGTADLPGSDRIGIVIAGSNLNNREVLAQGLALAGGRPTRPSYAADHLDSHLAGFLGEIFGIAAEGYSVGGASASGGVALALARRALLSGDLDAVLVVAPPGLLSAAELSAFGAIGALRRASDQPYQPFQRGCGGFVPGEGACAMMLQQGAAQVGRPGVRLRAAAMVLDAHRSTHADAAAELLVMHRALDQSGLSAASIAAVNAHATGTSQGDLAEAEALHELFDGVPPPPVSATKAITGHWLSGAGLIEAIIASLQVAEGFVPGNPFLTEPADPRLNYAPAQMLWRDCPAVLTSSFGFGGIQTCQILTKTED